jgi:hypothetical protein
MLRTAPDPALRRWHLWLAGAGLAASVLVIVALLGADRLSAAFLGRPGFSRRSAASR